MDDAGMWLRLAFLAVVIGVPWGMGMIAIIAMVMAAVKRRSGGR